MMHAGAGAGARKPELSHLLTSVGRLSIRRWEVPLEELNPKLDFVSPPVSHVVIAVSHRRHAAGLELAHALVSADLPEQVPTRPDADELNCGNRGDVLCS